MLNDRIKELRIERNWSQAELGKKIGTDPHIISRYEAGKVTPSIETIIKLIKIFEVSADYLLFDNVSKMPVDLEPDLLEKVREISSLTDEDKQSLFHILESMLAKNQFKSLANKIK